ncbi:hypothetical protein HF1_05340 [Mycoplasma haemofelis str. Langford 1]|uniref:Uncharacterized protein n=1 Tax=Mycoplasma haemofelis (strain Langford 1) TaxID=941640 RepID=E8ZHC1_MYCHL|nr:hypothetical protein [Mycoplasma haemofelis]CBY92542.1 hypothetical protein HF1_05340 [Mycoplasma haemofelis str. Langford 1]
MASKLTLVGIPSAVVGAAGVSAYSMGDNSKSLKKLKDLFDSTEGRILLDAIGDKHDLVWQQIVKEHGESSSKIKGVNSKETLKAYCSRTADSTNSGDLTVYSAWCSRNTFRAQMNSSTKKWNDSEVDTEWEKNKQAYSQESTENFLITKAGTQENIEKASITPQDLRDWCSKRALSPFINTEDKDYLIADKFCFKIQ